MKKLPLKIFIFMMCGLPIWQGHAEENESSDLINGIRLSIKNEHKNVVQDYTCIENYLEGKRDNKGLDAVANSRATYDRLYKMVFTDISMEELKKLTRKNIEDFAKIETTRLVFQDSGLAMCVYFGFHFQDVNIRAGNEPL